MSATILQMKLIHNVIEKQTRHAEQDSWIDRGRNWYAAGGSVDSMMRKITYYRIAAVFPIVLPLTAKLIDVAWGDPLASFPAVWIVVDSLAGAAIVFGPLYAALSALALFWLRNRPSGSYEKLAFAAPLLMGGAVSMWALLQEGFYGSPAGTTTIGPLFLMTVCVGYLYVFVAFGVLLVLQQLRLVDGAVSS